MSDTKGYHPHSASVAGMSKPMSTSSMVDYILYDFWEERQDTAAAHLPLIGEGPWKVLFIVGLYLLAIVIGKRVMKNRPPYSCQKAMIYYNLFNVVVNLIGFVVAFIGTNFGLDVWGCKKKYFAPHLLYLGYGYLILKFIDFLDTLFFILRKKDNQITFLHVTHHCLMPITCYVGLKFVPYGNTGFTPIINSFVHVIMYFYYYLAALGPHMQKYLWWKNYITGKRPKETPKERPQDTEKDRQVSLHTEFNSTKQIDMLSRKHLFVVSQLISCLSLIIRALNHLCSYKPFSLSLSLSAHYLSLIKFVLTFHSR